MKDRMKKRHENQRKEKKIVRKTKEGKKAKG
jgi:hypothetical protein